MAVKTWNPAFEAELLKAQDYRAFLRLFFKPQAHANPKSLSYQEFADRAGFASKSFMADVLSGRKRLSRESFDKVTTGLKLNNYWADFLKCLLALEEPTFRSGKHDEVYYFQRLETLRLRLIKKKSVRKIKGDSPLIQALLEIDFSEVYASLGSLHSGASLDDICARCGLPEARALLALDAMEDAGFARKDTLHNRYLPLTAAIEMDGLKSTPLFHQDFLRSFEKAKKRFEHQAKSNDSLFTTQTFSVDSKRLSEFREELSRLITSFADDSETAEGDTIAEICLAFTHTHSRKI